MSILDSINKAESEADKIREEAKNKAREILMKSQSQARQQSDKKINEVKIQNDQKLNELEKQITKKYQSYLEDKRHENSNIAIKAQKNLQKASSYIVEQVLNQ